MGAEQQAVNTVLPYQDLIKLNAPCQGDTVQQTLDKMFFIYLILIVHYLIIEPGINTVRLTLSKKQPYGFKFVVMMHIYVHIVTVIMMEESHLSSPDFDSDTSCHSL